MTDLLKKRIVLAGLKKKLEDGDQRELARRMDTYPARISDALNGFVRNMPFLNGLETEIRELLREREAVKSQKSKYQYDISDQIVHSKT